MQLHYHATKSERQENSSPIRDRENPTQPSKYTWSVISMISSSYLRLWGIYDSTIPIRGTGFKKSPYSGVSLDLASHAIPFVLSDFRGADNLCTSSIPVPEIYFHERPPCETFDGSQQQELEVQIPLARLVI